MKYQDYICRTCGFNSLEKPGAYKCPKCGSIMEIANHSMFNNDKTQYDRNNTWVVLGFVFGLPFCALLGMILLRSLWGVLLGGVVFFVLLLKFLPSDNKDKAIPLNEYNNGFCWNCGVEINSDDSFCSKCGDVIKKE